jgi:cytochrome c oxidase cbb3-type subunit 3
LGIASLDDPALKRMRIGLHVVGADYVPPGQVLAARGLQANLVGFNIFGAAGEEEPAGKPVRALEQGEIDVAVLWGPFAGYFARSRKGALEVSPGFEKRQRAGRAAGFRDLAGRASGEPGAARRVERRARRACGGSKAAVGQLWSSGGGSVRAVVALLLVLTLHSCKRESRDLYVTEGGRTVPSLSYRESSLVPGGQPPIPQGHTTAVLPRVNPYAGNAYAVVEGEKLFLNYNCSGCHGMGGGGIGPPLMERSWLYGHMPEQVYESIARGRPNGMPAWGTRLPEFQIRQLVTYVRSLGSLEPKSARGARSDSLATTSEQPRQPAEDVQAQEER